MANVNVGEFDLWTHTSALTPLFCFSDNITGLCIVGLCVSITPGKTKLFRSQLTSASTADAYLGIADNPVLPINCEEELSNDNQAEKLSCFLNKVAIVTILSVQGCPDGSVG